MCRAAGKQNASMRQSPNAQEADGAARAQDNPKKWMVAVALAVLLVAGAYLVVGIPADAAAKVRAAADEGPIELGSTDDVGVVFLLKKGMMKRDSDSYRVEYLNW